ncbi:MAG: hypothetical protein RIQ81_1685 [Pseudomonadota bacterium]
MGRKFWIGFMAAFIATQGRAFAEEIKWPKTGHEFRSGLSFDNRGFQNPEDTQRERPAANMAIERMKLKLTGELAPSITFFIRLAFEPTAKTPLDYAMLRLQLDPRWSIGSGRTWNHISGYEWPYSLTEYVGTGGFPMTQGATAILSGYSKQTFEVAFQASPESPSWKLQIIDDVKIIEDDAGVRTGGGYYSSGTQPAATFQVQIPGFLGTAWKPMLQLATYDAGHSRIATLGALYQEGPWLGFLHMAQDQQGRRNGEEEFIHRRSYVSGLVEYASGEWTPFIRWQWFDIRQGDGDKKGNSADVTETGEIDDNITSLSIGTRWTRYTDKFMPYFGLAGSQARFEETSNADKFGHRFLLQVKAGVMSKM